MKTAITVQIDGSSLPQFFLSKLQELPNATVNLLYKRKCTWLHALVKSLSAVAVEMLKKHLQHFIQSQQEC